MLKNIRKTYHHRKIINKSILFDAEYYSRAHNLAWYVNAARHFCTIGWRKSYNPSRYFDVAYYLNTYPDVRQTGANPLIHYLTNGAQEGRRPTGEFDGNAFRLAHPEHEQDNPAEACITRYGTYAWQDAPPILSALPEDVIKAFKPYFDEAFYRSFNIDVLIGESDCYDHFITRGQYENRDPAPGFDLHAYRCKIAANPAPLNNPIYHFVKVGSSHGARTTSENSIVLQPVPTVGDEASNLKICVHAHCFYPELIAELLPHFLSFSAQTRFVLTVSSEADRHFIDRACKRQAFPNSIDLRIVSNKGRDLAPLIVGCKDLWWDSDILLHVHTKRSPHLSWGDAWRQYLFNQTMGSPGLVNAVLQRFAEEPDLGCLYPRNFCHVRRYTLNEVNRFGIDAILGRLGYTIPDSWLDDYPAGSMAWYRTAPLRPLVDAFGSSDHFEDEAQQTDSTFAHALERGLPFAAKAAGSRLVSYVTPFRIGPAPLKDLPQREESGAPIPKGPVANANVPSFTDR